MQSFKDLTGQHWEISFSVMLRRVIRQRHAIDVLTLLEQATLQRFAAEPELWVDIIWACLEAQAIARRVDIETMFSRLINEETMETIVDLMFEESIVYAPEKKGDDAQAVDDLHQDRIENDSHLDDAHREYRRRRNRGRSNQGDRALTTSEIDTWENQLAGILGINPASFTLRELIEMVEERRKADLDGPALLAAVLINVHSSKRSTVTPLDCHPFREQTTRGTKLTAGNIWTIAQAIVRK